MRVLLTGASGVLGRQLIHLLQPSKQFRLISLSRSPLDLCQEHVCHDLTKPLNISHRFDAVIHAAATVDQSSSDIDLLANNIGMAVNAAKLALDSGAKYFVNISSIAVYGSMRAKEVFEDSELLPNSFYGLSKKFAEEIIDYLLSDKVTHCHLRLGYVLAFPSPQRYFLTRLVSQLQTGAPVQLTNAQSTRFCFIDSRDIARTCAQFIEKRVVGKFNLVGDEAPTVMQVYEELVKLTGKRSPLRLADDLSASLTTTVSNKKISVLLAPQKLISWRQSLVDLVREGAN